MYRNAETPPPVNMFVVKIQSLECFSRCFEWETTNMFYFLWFCCTAALFQWHAFRKTRIDSVLTALCVIVVAAALSSVHSQLLELDEPLDGRWLMLWNFVTFVVCWALSNVVHDAETEFNAPLLYSRAAPQLVMGKGVCVEKDNRPRRERPYYDIIQKLKIRSQPRTSTQQSTTVAPVFSRLRLVWFGIIIGAMLILKHGLKVHMDYILMICWVSFAVMTSIIERYLGLKRWFMIKYRHFKPTHDARSPWRVTNDKLEDTFCPLLVFVNPNSGGNLGSLLLEHVQELNLNELQVWNMSWGDPIYAFRPFDDCLRAGRKLRVLVCGGDGTVAWVLGPTGVGGLPEKLREYVTVAILPLGTGNDLARALGWGSGYSGDRDALKQIIGELCRANEVPLDRWRVKVTTPAVKRRGSFAFGRRRTISGSSKKAAASLAKSKTTTHLMNNYIGFGCGAQIFNKLVYGLIGGGQVIKHVVDRLTTAETLENSIEIKCDGRSVSLKDYEGIIIMNIAYYGGGMNMWDRAMDIEPDSPSMHGSKSPEFFASKSNLESFRLDSNSDDVRRRLMNHRRRISSSNANQCQSFNDRMLEVIGVRMANLAVGQIGLPTGERLEQCSKIEIKLKRSIAMQIDGEPEMLPAGGSVMITHHQQAIMLQRSQTLSNESAGVLRSVLQWGKAQGFLRQAQVDRLNSELGRRMTDSEKMF